MRLRIDELAREAGTTSRNVRAYQARGLLPAPELDGRTGYYGEEHLRRLEIIGDLQKRGFSLEAIRHTLDAWSQGGDLAHLVGFRNIVAAPLSDEQPQSLTAEDVFARFPEAADDPDLVSRAVELGLIDVEEDGTFSAASPFLIEAGAALVSAGVPLEAILDLVEAIRPDLADVAAHFVGLVSDHLAVPALENVSDPEDFNAVIESIRQLRPIALEVVRPMMAREMDAAIENAIQRRAADAVAGEGVAGDAEEAATPERKGSSTRGRRRGGASTARPARTGKRGKRTH